MKIYSSRTHTNHQSGGGSHLGPSKSDVSVLGMLANYWYRTLGKQVWWSDNQLGYYFTNLMNNYQSRVHVHVIDGMIEKIPLFEKHQTMIFRYVATCYGRHPMRGEIIARDFPYD